jgi:hypothetical protein
MSIMYGTPMAGVAAVFAAAAARSTVTRDQARFDTKGGTRAKRHV